MTWKAQTSQRTKRPCHEAAKARGWRGAGDFTDEGISGAVADLTRLSRSTDLAPLLERLKFRSVPARVEPLNVVSRTRTAASARGAGGLRASGRLRTARPSWTGAWGPGRAQAAKVASVPAEALYRVAVRALVATLEGANIEAAVRSLVGTAPVFEQAGVLWGRIGMSGAALLRVAGVDERAGSGGPI